MSKIERWTRAARRWIAEVEGQLISHRRHCFPPEIIRHTVWVYLPFTLSYADVEDLLAERGLDVSYEMVQPKLDEAAAVKLMRKLLKK